ncbi:MAG: response regulator [Thermodesulfovibrionales bacterium]|jgi:two-component system cell cycle response regulator DivK
MTMKGKILVVEDDAVNRKFFESLLRERGYHVLTAADGEEALALIKRESPSLVLLDVGMPQVTGIEVLKRCKEEGLLAGKKIYAVTGSLDQDIDEAGFDGIIRKPVRITKFLETIKKALE